MLGGRAEQLPGHAAARVSASAFELRRETVSQWRLFVPPLLALALLLSLPDLPGRRAPAC